MRTASFKEESTHDAYENTWKCGELKLYFSSSAGGLKKKKKSRTVPQVAKGGGVQVVCGIPKK